jgi:NAD(P)-dependent dehydrogenase (short-subunit alcohol dehydrogenase family)
MCDVTSDNAVAKLFSRFVPTLRHPIRGLVNCVGVSENWPVVDFPAARFKRLFDINVAGTLIVAQAVAREVIKSGVSASMVFIGSISGSVSNRVSFYPWA